MARRYGRNQKRRHREEIAKLERFHHYATERYREAERHLNETRAALQEALGGGWQLAELEKDVYLLPEGATLSWDDTTRMTKRDGCREEIRREARVVIYPDQDLTDRLTMRHRDYKSISFRGLAWKIDQVSVQGRGGRGYVSDPIEVELELRTFARRS